MKTKLGMLIVFVSAALNLFSQSGQTRIAFKNVNLITMENDRVIPGQTVLVEGDRITFIGHTDQAVIPDSTAIIEGTGLFLLPGLTDAHVHLEDYVGARENFGDAPLFLSSGITCVFNLRGLPFNVEWKNKIKDGSLIAPNLYNSGEFVNEPRINTVEEAIKEVNDQKNAGYDFIKFREVINFETGEPLTTEGLNHDAYLALNQEARRLGMPIVGHAPYKVGLDGLIESGQSIAHINELANLYFSIPLDLSSGRFIPLTKYALAGFVFVFLIYLPVFLYLRKKNRSNSEFKTGTRRSFLYIAMIGLFSIISILLWLLVVPSGYLFGNYILLTLMSVCGLCVGICFALLLVHIIKKFKYLIHHPSVMIFTLLLFLISIPVMTGLFRWLPVAWRSSDHQINTVAEKISDAGIFVQTTISCQETFFSQKEGFVNSEILKEKETAFLPDGMIEQWQGFAQFERPWYTPLWKNHTKFLKNLCMALNQKGVLLMAGTDAYGLPLVMPGHSLHKELKLISECGLSNYEVIKTATVNPAKFMHQENEYGTITVGKRADMILIQGNPFDNLTNLKNITGVMVNGHWLPKATLDSMLTQMPK